MPVFDEGDDSWIGGGGGTGGGTGGSTQTAIPDLFETATLQVLIGEGRIDGLVDGLKSVYLDGTPILNSDGSKNFKGVALALVAGTNTQAAVKGVGGVESEVSVNVQVTNAASVTRSITSNPSAIRVRIALPALKIIKTDGGSTGHSVTVKIERQNAAHNGGAWEIVPLENAGVIRGGPYSSKFTRSFRVDLPAAGTWQVRVTRMSNDDADAYHASQTWWEAYTEVIDARLRYPNSAVLSLRVNAQQFRSIPRVTCDLKLARIQVPANYDPITRDYAITGTGTTGGAWDGTFKEAWSDNPAWVFLDAATNPRYGAGSFLSVSGLDKWSLYAISQWCDASETGTYVGVSDGKGGTEPRMTCNLYMQNQQNAIKALGQLASIFWGVIYYASGLVVPVADANTAPVAVFNSSNVIEGKFTYEGTARSARHTAAVVKFTNPDLGWEPDTAVYEDAEGIARFGYNPLDLTALGCTSHGQALRLAKWSILTELLADETITFSSGLEGSTVKPGDVVQVHDQFRAGNVRFGGRVASGATTTVIPLDAPVTFGAGTHYLKIKNASGVLETRTVTTAAGTVSSLTVSSGFSVAPAAGAVWLLQAGTEASLWRVLAIRKGEGITYDITALKHDPAKYVLLGLSAGEVLPRDVDPRTSPAPAGLAVTATTRILNDRQVQNLEANWTLDGALSYAAVASKDYGPWVTMAVSGATAILSGIDPGSWRVRVVGSWPAGNSPFAEATAVVTAPATQPPWVADAASAAAAAAAAASNAQTAANTANTALANIASDSLLTPDEKPRVIQDRDVIIAEQAGIDAQATAYSITTEKTAYDSAVSALTTYLATLTSPVLWSNLTGNTTIVGATFRGKFADVYAKRQSLLNKIFERAKALADGAQGTANSALSTANAAVSAAATAQSTADGKIESFYQTTAPGSASEGDLWFDTDDGNKIYTRRSGVWVATQDSAIGAAIAAAATAQGTADGKARIYYQAAQPTGLAAADQGDLWCDTDANYKLWAWTGSAWVLAQDWQTANAAAAAAQADADAANAIIAAASLDTKITNLERPRLRTLRASLAASVTSAKAKADAMVPAVAHTALDTAWTTFATNVDPILAATTDSAIVKATFDGWWSAVYSAITDLQGVMAIQAQAGVNTINDPDTLTPGEKPQIIQDYNAIVSENAKLLADGAIYAPTKRAAYALIYGDWYTTYLGDAGYVGGTISATPVGWHNTTGHTALGAGKRASEWNPKWLAVRSAANDLRAAIASGIFNESVAQSATTAMQRVDFLDPVTGKIPAVDKIVPGSVTGNLIAANTILAKNMTVANFDNLVPNANSELDLANIGSAEIEAAGVTTAEAYAGTRCRQVQGNGTGNTFTVLTDYIQVAEGEQYYAEAMLKRTGTAGGAALVVLFYGPSKSYINAVWSTTIKTATWAKSSRTAIIPAGVCFVRLALSGTTDGTAYLPVGQYARGDNFYLRRMNDANLIVDGAITAQKLEANLAIVGVVRSPNYVAGSFGNAPQGFKLSGYAFTTTFKDGSTSANCYQEMGGDGNFGGRKVATVNDRVFQTFNRLTNGKFAYSAAPWAISGTYTTWNATSKTAGTGSLLTSISGASDETSTITQSFAMPVAPGTVTLQLVTGFSVAVSSGSGTATNEVKAYILNTTTGTETLVGTWSYSATANTTLAWTDRSVDISSLVAAGGDFALRLTNRVTRTGLFATVNGYIDEVSIIA